MTAAPAVAQTISFGLQPAAGDPRERGDLAALPDSRGSTGSQDLQASQCCRQSDHDGREHRLARVGTNEHGPLTLGRFPMKVSNRILRPIYHTKVYLIM